MKPIILAILCSPILNSAPAAAHEGGVSYIQAPSSVKSLQTTLQPVSDVYTVVLPDAYAWGNCTYFVASAVAVPQNLGNAADWAVNAAAQGYTVTATPKVGAVAQTTAGGLGHVALVEAVAGDQVLVKEMNVAGLDVIDQAWYPISYFSYIYF